jgi:hypothetical protein
MRGVTIQGRVPRGHAECDSLRCGAMSKPPLAALAKTAHFGLIGAYVMPYFFSL